MHRPPEHDLRAAGNRASRQRGGAPVTLLAGLGYLVASVALHHDALPRLGTATTGSVTSDAYLFAWWLNWFPWSLQHGLDPQFTTYMHHPVGVNGMWNTTIPALAALLAPVTLTGGPTVAYNAAMILGPVASGVALMLALKPYVARAIPRAVAGLLYGFSPFVVAHSSVGHANLVWAVLPPVLLWAVHAVLVRPSATPLRDGALLGVAFAVQTVLYSQTVAFGALVLVVVAAVLAVRWPRAVAARVPQVATAAAACVVTYAVLCAYPLYLLLAGPARPHGRIRDPAIAGADAANTVVPTHLTAVRLGTGDAAERLRSRAGEQGGYIGVAVLVVLAVTLVVTRSAVARTAAAVGAVLYVLSLGVSLVVLGHDTAVPLPWAIVNRLPLISQAEPVRLQIFVALCVTVVVAVWLDHLPDPLPGHPADPAHRPRRVRHAVQAGLTAAALATWVPADAQVATPVVAPAFFAHSAAAELDGDVVETVPRITGEWTGGTDPLMWQMASGMAYRTTGGYFIGSDARHDLLLEAPVGEFQRGVAAAEQGRPPPAGAARTAERELRDAGVTVVVLAARSGDRRAVVTWARQVTGTPGRRVDDAWLFRMAPRPA